MMRICINDAWLSGDKCRAIFYQPGILSAKFLRRRQIFVSVIRMQHAILSPSKHIILTSSTNMLYASAVNRKNKFRQILWLSICLNRTPVLFGAKSSKQCLQLCPTLLRWVRPLDLMTSVLRGIAIINPFSPV